MTATSTLEPRLLEISRELRLGPRVLDLYKNVEFTTPIEYLVTLLQLICDERAEERVQRNRKNAGFRGEKFLSNFDNSNLELPPTITWDYITSCKFIADKMNLFLSGNPGTGKTHLATALGIAACEHGFKPAFYSVTGLIESLNNAFNAGTHNDLIKRIVRHDVIILDEMGYVPLPQRGTELLFQFVSACEERTSLIITSNFPFSEWNRVLGSERLVNAIVDRLVEHCYCIKHGGESRRLAHSLMLNGLS